LREPDETSMTDQDKALNMERVKRRLDMLDQRLDNIDSMVTAVAERVMRQPLTLNIICPHCGKNIEIALIGQNKPGL
jgi:hypothetical protein